MTHPTATLRRVFRNPQSAFRTSSERHGSVLIVVIGLLLLMMLIGIAFFTFANQENSSAEYYSDSAKVYSNASDSSIFDMALEQLIIGPYDNNQQSQLWPGLYSLVPNMLGMFGPNPNATYLPTVPLDRHMFNGGYGINIIAGPNGQAWLDQNMNGVNDAGEGLPNYIDFIRNMNLSGAAQLSSSGIPQAQTRQAIFQNFPAIDVGYTYPDRNNMFLSYQGTFSVGAANNPTAYPNIIPSFHRPQYLRSSGGAPLNGWQIDGSPLYAGVADPGVDTTTSVLRPHPNHVCVVNPSFPRFLTSAVTVGARTIQPFPFTSGPGSTAQYGGNMGVWSNSFPTPLALGYDVDNDNDGILEGIWLDLGYPVTTLPDGTISVPLVSYTVLDADSLLNLNAHGNMSRFAGLSPSLSGPPLLMMGGPGNNTPISGSNLGMSPNEVNPLWALTANLFDGNFIAQPVPPAVYPSAAQFQAMAQYRAFFQQGSNPTGYGPDRVAIGNTDMLFLLWGRPSYTVTPGGGGSEIYTLTDLTPGLWGELSALLNGTNTGDWTRFPRPGQSNNDDNGDRFAGVAEIDPVLNQLGSSIPFPPFSHPLDYFGAGSFLSVGANGQIASLVNLNPNTPPPPPSAARFLQYTQYQMQFNPSGNPAFGPNQASLYATMSVAYPPLGAGVFETYQGVMQGNYLSQSPYAFAVLPGPPSVTLPGNVDDPSEVVNDPRYPQASDQMFTYDEMPGLHLSQGDYLTGLGQSRLRALASFNFDLNQQAAIIRKRFTVGSWDRKNHGFAYNAARTWEYGVNSFNAANNPIYNNWDGSTTADGSTVYQFPPMVFGNSVAGQVPQSENSLSGAAATTNANGNVPEPFRMELAALIGAKVNNAQYRLDIPTGTAVLKNAFAFNTAAYDFPTLNNTASIWQQQGRLDINRILTTLDPSQAMTLSSLPNLPNGNPLRYRELTPHPTMAQWTSATNTGFAAIPSGTPSTTATLAYPSVTSKTSFTNNPQLQEYWARRDRQLMARDIYVMLYMFGGGAEYNAAGNQINYATTSNKPMAGVRPLYADWQLQEMAQFAVNYVDALDRDDTITMFEYDADLSDGWNLDDNPVTVDLSGDRGVVYGVEAQQLAFNEALVVVARMVKDTTGTMPKDHPATLWDDSKQDRTFTYLELFNVSPYAVPLNNQNWQIMLLNPVAGTFSGLNPPASSGLHLLTLNDSINVSAPAGRPYVIGSRTNIVGTDDVTGSPFASTLVVDPQWNSGTAKPDPAFNTPSMSQMVPAYNALITPPITLDLVTSAYTSGGTLKPTGQWPYVLTDGSYNLDTTVGDFVNFGPDVTAGPFANNYLTTFILRRRLNLNRPTPQIGSGTYVNDDADNPWIEVDRITYQNTFAAAITSGSASNTPAGGFFALGDPNLPNAATNDIQPNLQRLTSRERKQPLDGFDGNSSPASPTVPPGFPTTYGTHVITYPTPSGANFSPNTLGNTNNATSNVPGGLFTLWQPHFDRDFASVMELLSIPLYGPSVLTQCLAPKDSTGLSAINNLAVETPLPAAAGGVYQPLVAQAKIFRPQNPQNVGLAPAAVNPQIDNRWHRVFELLEVPTRSNMQIDNFLLGNFPWLSPTPLQRAPGKLNLNTLRNAENLFALLDDPSQFNLFGYQKDGSYQDFKDNANRNWWQQLQQARDALDPQISSALGGGLNAYVAGAPGSRPFRSFSFSERNPDNFVQFPPGTTPIAPGTALPTSIDDTLLCSLPLDPISGTATSKLEQRRLFEARLAGDTVAQAGNLAESVDYYTRNRLLSKIAGNTTNRSNVFIVWITIGYFNGYQPDPTNNPKVIQIGNEISTAATRSRGFFIVDRSLLEDAWNPNTGTYDYRKFIQYRKTIQ